MQFFTDKMSEFCRRKNREIDELKKERDFEISEKVKTMQELDSMIKLNEVKEERMLQKFCLILNEKKNKIKELKSILNALEGSDLSKVPKEVDK